MRKERMNNKGFSLVELIIVIAIMAILLVVLAPQYLKYVERSRNSTDLQNATEIVTALQVYAADPEATVTPADGTITIGNTPATPAGFAQAALRDAGLLAPASTGAEPTILQTRCQSRTTWATYTITWTVEDGQLNFTYTATAPTGGNNTAATTAFANRMMGATNTPTTNTPTTPGE